MPVKVHLPSGDTLLGSLSYTANGPDLSIKGSSEPNFENERIELSLLDSETENNLSLHHNTRFEYLSNSVIKKYSIDSLPLQEMYPPSSKGWISHLSESGTEAIFSIQRIIGENRHLLSVVDLATNKMRMIHPIHTYEIDVLFMETDWDRYNRIVDESSADIAEVPLLDLLNGPTASWSKLAELLDGVNIPNLKLGSTMRETMEQLVPNSFPDNIRLELMAFLAYVTNSQIPEEDPVDFQITMRKRFQSAPLLRLLVYSHVQCLIEGIKPPQYVRIMAMADKGLLRTGVEPSPIETDPWVTTWHRLMEMFPDSKGRIIDIAKELNKAQDILTQLPISKLEAKKSRESWIDRFSMIRNGLMIRGYVQENRLGLVKLAYLGGTHRWPHKHLAWLARLGNPESKPPYIQIMVMPSSAATTLTRLRERISRIDWSASRINYRLCNPRNLLWKANLAPIIQSFSRQRSIKELNKEFGFYTNGNIRIPNEAEARVIDLASFGMYLSSLELGSYNELLKMPIDSMKEILGRFQDQGVIQLHYFSYLAGLVSLCIEMKGELNQLNSFARASLIHLPSAQALISEKNQVCYILGRVPEQSAFEILTNLPARASEHGLYLKSYRVSAYVDYLHNLHQRLIKADGLWDDDISNFLSQIRT